MYLQAAQMDSHTEKLRHSSAHVLAMAAIRIFPDVKLGIGPVTKSGFYYDFEFPHKISWEDVKRIESEMNLIVQEDIPITQLTVPKEQAFDILLRRGQVFKAELLRDLSEYEVSFYKIGEEFLDLCSGPHLNSTGEIGALLLENLELAFWKNNDTRPQMQRINGLAFNNFEELQEFQKQQEAIRERDFRAILKKLNLSLGGNKQVIYSPEGTTILKTLSKLITDPIVEEGYMQVTGPSVMSWNRIGQDLDRFYSSKNRSYKELPVKLYSTTRHELRDSIDIAGKELQSVTTIVSRAYFREDEVKIQIGKALLPAVQTMEKLGLSYTAQIKVPDIDLPLLESISGYLQKQGISQIQIVSPDMNAIEVDLVTSDSLGREWTLTKFELIISGNLKYVDRKGEITPTYVLTNYWILDKLLAYFLEHEEGMLPMWLAPTQIQLIPIAETQLRFTEQVLKMLEQEGYRVKIDNRSETMQAKIRSAELLRVPVIVIIGDKEVQSNSVSIRLRNRQEVGMVALDSLLETLKDYK